MNFWRMFRNTKDYPNNNFMSIERRCQAMDYELITVREYWGNNFEGSRQAKLYADGRLVYEPEPDYPDEDEEEDDDENE
jgi:hypothetical protein